MTGPILMKYFRQSWNKGHHNEEDEISARGKIVVITGASQGIGEVTATEFAKRGSTVFLACRDVSKGRKVTEKIKAQFPDAKIEVVAIDVGDMKSVRNCAQEIRLKTNHIDIFINNAAVGILDVKVHKSVDGFEAHIAINYLGHFLFTMLILDLIKNGNSSKIVNLTSGSFEFALPRFDPDDLLLEKYTSFEPNYIPLANAKLAIVYFTRALSKYLDGSGVTANVMCPGSVRTPGQAEGIKNENWCVRKLAHLMSMTPEQGVETILYLGLSSKCATETGKMYRFCKPFEPMPALNDEHERRVWEKSAVLVGVNVE